MALVAEKWGLIPELQSFAKAGRPVWGTCAGMIFLAERAKGGLLGSWHQCNWLATWSEQPLLRPQQQPVGRNGPLLGTLLTASTVHCVMLCAVVMYVWNVHCSDAQTLTKPKG